MSKSSEKRPESIQNLSVLILSWPFSNAARSSSLNTYFDWAVEEVFLKPDVSKSRSGNGMNFFGSVTRLIYGDCGFGRW